eukprot:scaffold20243_cov151-Skeletonema_marinoi.AAC.1
MPRMLSSSQWMAWTAVGSVHKWGGRSVTTLTLMLVLILFQAALVLAQTSYTESGDGMGRIRMGSELKGVSMSVYSLEALSQVMLVMMLARRRPNALSEVEILRTWVRALGRVGDGLREDVLRGLLLWDCFGVGGVNTRM